MLTAKPRQRSQIAERDQSGDHRGRVLGHAVAVADMCDHGTGHQQCQADSRGDPDRRPGQSDQQPARAGDFERSDTAVGGGGVAQTRGTFPHRREGERLGRTERHDPGRPLSGIDTQYLVPAVERLRLLRWQPGQFVGFGDDSDPQPARIHQIETQPAERLRQRLRPPTGFLAQAQQIAGTVTAPHQHAG